MIKDTLVKVKGHSRNKKYYSDIGYNVVVGEYFFVDPLHLSKGSTSRVTCICTNCGKEVSSLFKDYWNYTNGLIDIYLCNSCKYIKSEKTSLIRWGVKNPMQNNEVKERLRNSLIDKYGVPHYSKTEDWLNKFKGTSLKKWGYDNPSKNPDIICDIREKNSDFLKSSEFRIVSKQSKQRNTWRKYEKMLPVEYSVVKYDTDVFEINHLDCVNFSITKSMLYNRLKSKSIICTDCNPIDHKMSSFEIEVGLFLSEIGVSFKSGDRTLLKGLELDYLIPDLNLAIECNGVYWHNELFKSKDYHIKKTKMCLDNGIKLIHIWEDDWLLKKDIVKSILKNKMFLVDKRIFARNCKIENVSTKDYREFLENNHIQGYASSSYNIGLYYNNELVSLMTFGWRRTNNKREFELIRFCNKLNYLVIGSASKLFKYFIKNINGVSAIVSYSDISIFGGGLYDKLGFLNNGLSKPNYFWVVDGVRRHRYNYSKRKLINDGYDPNKTEVEIMNDRGYWRVFSTGQERWVYNI